MFAFKAWSGPNATPQAEPPPSVAVAILAVARGARAYPAVGRPARLARVDRLIAAGAWTEAALELVDLGACGWQLSRIAIDDGEWQCTLSRHPHLPAVFDDVADGHGRVLPLAVLDAIATAQQIDEAAARPSGDAPSVHVHTVPAWCEDAR